MSQEIFKPKILVLIGHFLPGTKVGGPITSVVNIINSLKEVYSFYIATTNVDFNEIEKYEDVIIGSWVNRYNANILYLEKNILTYFGLIKNIRKLQPDVLYLNPLLDPIFSISIVISFKIGLIKASKIVVAPRGELFDEALDFKKSKKRVFLFTAKFLNLYTDVVWHATTEIEKNEIVRKMGVVSGKVLVARNISSFYSDKKSIVNKYSAKSNIFKIVFLARISKDKNVPFTLDILSAIIDIKIQFDIYGQMEDDDVWAICVDKISKLPENISVTYHGSLPKNKVTEVLAEYDISFLPTHAENYGHTIAEALGVGTPVLISDNTPWRNLKEKGLGWDISLLNPTGFIDAIREEHSKSYDIRLQERLVRKEMAMKILRDDSIKEENIKLFQT